jgi:hypothetical protein
MKELHNKNYKTSMNEIEKDTKMWKDFPCSWKRRTNIIEMSILPKAIYRFNGILTKNVNDIQHN